MPIPRAALTPRFALALPAALALVTSSPALAQRPGKEKEIPYPPLVDYAREIQPILDRACVECHGPHKASGGLQLTSGAKLMEGGFSGVPVIVNNGDGSYLIKRLRGEDGEDRMPLRAEPLSAKEIDTIWRWIKQGAVVPPESAPEFEPKPAGLSRLTVQQYRNSLRSLFGDGVELPADLEPDMIISGSTVVGAARIGMSRQATEKFAEAAFRVARQALADAAFRARWMACLPMDRRGRAPRSWSDEVESCVDRFLARFGRRAWRRPLTSDERMRYLYLAAEATRRRADVTRGLESAVAGLLQSPHFLYRVEIGEPDAQYPKQRRLTDYEIATRLSLFLTGTIPDDELLDAAAAGQLSTLPGLEAQAERLLRTPQARETVRSFFAELFNLHRLPWVVRTRKAFGGSKDLAGPMQEETLRVIEHVLFEGDRDFREIFEERTTFVNAALARHYGLPVSAPEGDFVRVDLPSGGPRLGVLGHASFLSIHSSRTASSPTLRGKFIREQLLCQAVPPPPPNVSNVLPEEHEDGQPRTTRQRLDLHRTVPQCRACHKAMDPMGLAFEHFDAAGAYRETENGLPIDATGDFDGVEFRDAAELGRLLRHSPKVGTCVARNLFRFATGALESDADEPIIEEFSALLESSGYRFKSLLLAVVASRGFRYVAVPR